MAFVLGRDHSLHNTNRHDVHSIAFLSWFDEFCRPRRPRSRLGASRRPRQPPRLPASRPVRPRPRLVLLSNVLSMLSHAHRLYVCLHTLWHLIVCDFAFWKALRGPVSDQKRFAVFSTHDQLTSVLQPAAASTKAPAAAKKAPAVAKKAPAAAKKAPAKASSRKSLPATSSKVRPQLWIWSLFHVCRSECLHYRCLKCAPWNSNLK